MAKWGEGDPCWIVEERPDATNVNNWHWTEKNACQWSIDKLKELLTDLKMENSYASCRVTEVDKCEGEAVANNRKGKLLFFYDWELKLKWKGHLHGADHVEIEGTAVISNFNEEQEASEINVDLAVDSSTPEADKLKDVITKDARELIRLQLEKYITALRADFSRGMILPRKSGTAPSEHGDVESLSRRVCGKITVAESKQEVQQPKNLKTTTLRMSVQLQCSVEEIYTALTDKEMIQVFTNSAVKMAEEAELGETFELLGGNIYGRFLELEPFSKICQTWRFSGWPEGHFSTVVIEIEDLFDCVEVKLIQKGVPESDLDVTRRNWNRYYWDAIKRTFGFGTFLV